jgi:hypothetical protein
LNNSPTSARRTSSSCTASAPRRLRNLAEPRRMRPVLRHKGWLNPHAPGIPLRTQQPLPPRAEQPHPPAPPEPHPKKHHRHLQSGERGLGWPGRRLERPGDLEPPSQTAASTKRLLGRPRMRSEPLSRRVTQTEMGTARQRRWSELWTSTEGQLAIRALPARDMLSSVQPTPNTDNRPAFALVSGLVEPPAGIEPATHPYH